MKSQQTKKEWYNDLDISLKGRPTGIEPIATLLPVGLCYCIISQDGIVDRFDVLKTARKFIIKSLGMTLWDVSWKTLCIPPIPMANGTLRMIFGTTNITRKQGSEQRKLYESRVHQPQKRFYMMNKVIEFGKQQ